MIVIDGALRDLIPSAALGALTCTADVAADSPEQLAAFDDLIRRSESIYPDLPSVAQNPRIAATRAAYKAVGTDPSKYRNSAEAMLRRVVKKNGLYRVNNAVDANNMISIESGYSLGSYDLAAVSGQIVFRVTPDGERYRGIADELGLKVDLDAYLDEVSRNIQLGAGAGECLRFCKRLRRLGIRQCNRRMQGKRQAAKPRKR